MQPFYQSALGKSRVKSVKTKLGALNNLMLRAEPINGSIRFTDVSGDTAAKKFATSKTLYARN